MVQNSKQSANFQSVDGLRAGLRDAAAVLAADLQQAPQDAQLEALCDTRALHHRLFAPLLPENMRFAAGVYRGTSETKLAMQERAVFIARKAPGLRNQDHCAKPEQVAPAMQALAARLQQIWAQPQPDDDQAYADLAEVTHQFLHIHPYMDGNGHIYRLILPILAQRLGLKARASWTIHPRPYDHVMSLCLQWYPHHPILLACYMRQWFDVESAAKKM